LKNSFFLVIPDQNHNPEQLKLFQEAALQHWILELPTANPGLATRLLYDLIKQFTVLKMDPAMRLEALELLRPSYLIIEEYLRARLTRISFPKGDDEKKIHSVLVGLEKEFTLGYWIVARELTKKQIGWFQNKNVTLSLERVIKGMSSIVMTYYIMSHVVPDWVWIDLHSLYKLAVKLKKETTKVPDLTNLQSKSSSILDSYRQILLLSLTDPTGLMQKEILQVYRFVEQITPLVELVNEPCGAENQCIILIDEDQPPLFSLLQDIDSESAILYLNFEKLVKAFRHKDNFTNVEEARFSSIHALKNTSEKLPVELLTYIEARWRGKRLQGASFFADRLDRCFSVGLKATYDLQNTTESSAEEQLEYIAQSSSDRSLSCLFKSQNVLSIGSLVSFRKTKLAKHKRSLGVVNKITIAADGKVIFEVDALTLQSHAVKFLPLDAEDDAEPQKALIYGVKTEQGEKSFLIIESFQYKDDDVIRLFMVNDNFPIILRDKKNVGLGYWQFECRQLLENEQMQKTTKQGYDFI
jgi:hypothetical protein